MATEYKEMKSLFPVGKVASANLWDATAKAFVLRTGKIVEVKPSLMVKLACVDGSVLFFSGRLLKMPV